MDWPQIIVEGFPGPRDGEPPDLRRDIADELNDHLACAMQRELRRTNDPAAAEHAVLDRFGNPKRVARQLWWDAMKEQVMKDRMMIGMMVLMLLVCVAVGVFAWQMMRQGQQINQAILAKLETLGKPAAQPEVAADWAKLTFRCFEGNGQGKPAANVSIELGGHAFIDAKEDWITQTTDDQGLTTFGPIRPGSYQWHIDSPGYERNREFLALYPGRIGEQIINIPSPEMQADTVLKVNWPDDLKQRKLVLCVEFSPRSLQVGSTAWEPRSWSAALATDGTLRTGYEVSGPSWPPDLPPASPFVWREPPSQGNRHALFIPEGQSVASEDHVRHPAASYRLSSLSVMFAAADLKHPSLRWVECARQEYDRRTQAPMFDARPGQLNTWTIDLPEALLQQAREGLVRDIEPLDMLTDVSLRVAWPADLADKGVALFCHFIPDETAPEKGEANQWWGINSWQTVVLADGNTVWGYSVTHTGSPRAMPRSSEAYSAFPPSSSRESATGVRLAKPDKEELSQQAVFRRPATTYRLVYMLAMNPANDPKQPQVKWTGIYCKGFDNWTEAPAFVAEKGKLNAWTITLPEVLEAQVRGYLTQHSEHRASSRPAS